MSNVLELSAKCLVSRWCKVALRFWYGIIRRSESARFTKLSYNVEMELMKTFHVFRISTHKCYLKLYLLEEPVSEKHVHSKRKKVHMSEVSVA